MKKLAVYIHIPFCIKKCAYCDFLSAPAEEEEREQYVKALVTEIKIRSEGLQDYRVTSVFFGGGTPSILTVSQLAAIFGVLQECFAFEKAAEITMECNPGTISADKLAGYQRLGINRLSIGLQSANEQELRLLGRIHSFEQFLSGYQEARAAGFDNINIDIMSALPGQTISSFEYTLRQVLALQPEHISSYSLMIEEGTPFYQCYREGGSKYNQLPDEDTEREMYELARKLFSAAGYQRYEISNYAKPGRECRHNICYWKRDEYLGFGLGAASLFKNCRSSVERNLAEYINKVKSGQEPVAQRQELSRQDAMEEFMFLGLRMCRGISKKRFQHVFFQELEEVYGEVLKKYLQMNLLEQSGDRIYLTEHGIDVSNVIFSEFLFDK